MVLEAGANPNPGILEGLYRSSPLTSASLGGLTEMAHLLIVNGATIDTQSARSAALLRTTIIYTEHEI
ncbi:hypothetical protein BDP55DRAFT_683763 [Colletotrichum godetiae]|uniref:Uncharacterized protein n=1 Tax=Colletotrichum godetiae TaxID=1209918 RepID=A0AAJ0ER30_9PEZI|nr:uncharacterized protein BDP55DRAFT_683763 [Colletotrichum godetiae]KAK1658083.1 hypothetical protein BDP55DRAFT_683763 [Colletotrichum godetiae]